MRTTRKCAKEASSAPRRRKSGYGARKTRTAILYPVTKEDVEVAQAHADKRPEGHYITIPDRDEQLSPRGGILTTKLINYELISNCRTP